MSSLYFQHFLIKCFRHLTKIRKDSFSGAAAKERDDIYPVLLSEIKTLFIDQDPDIFAHLIKINFVLIVKLRTFLFTDCEAGGFLPSERPLPSQSQVSQDTQNTFKAVLILFVFPSFYMFSVFPGVLPLPHGRRLEPEHLWVAGHRGLL